MERVDEAEEEFAQIDDQQHMQKHEESKTGDSQ